MAAKDPAQSLGVRQGTYILTPGRPTTTNSAISRKSSGKSSIVSNDSSPHDERQDEDVETDLEDEGLSGDLSHGDFYGKSVYMAACKQYGVIPSTQLLEQLTTEKVDMSHSAVGPKGAVALAICLVNNPCVAEFDISGNCIGIEGMRCLGQMLEENMCIHTLNLSSNNLGETGAEIIGQFISKNDQLRIINLSGNDFGEKGAEHLGPGLQNSPSIQTLNLSHNRFGEEGGVYLARAIAHNTSIETLDLSWNHLRMKGSRALAKSLMDNKYLLHLNLAWNGFANDGAFVIGEALKRNNTLEYLNLTCNRINMEGASYLGKGLAVNSCLRVLKLCKNPIATGGALHLLNVLKKNKKSQIVELDFKDVSVTYDFAVLLDELAALRPGLRISHGRFVRTADSYAQSFAQKEELRTDPMSLLMAYCRANGLRLWDMFAQFDRDGSMSISKEEFVTGIRMLRLIRNGSKLQEPFKTKTRSLMAKIPLTEKQLDRLVKKLDTDGDGEIDFAELVCGEKDYRQKKRQEAAADHGENLLVGTASTRASRPNTPDRRPNNLKNVATEQILLAKSALKQMESLRAVNTPKKTFRPSTPDNRHDSGQFATPGQTLRAKSGVKQKSALLDDAHDTVDSVIPKQNEDAKDTAKHNVQAAVTITVTEMP